MRCYYQVIGCGWQSEFVDSHRWQIVVDLVPRLASVQGTTRSKLGAQEQKVGIDKVLPQYPRGAGGQIGAQRFPGLAKILGHVDVGLIVVRTMSIEGHIGASISETRRLDACHPTGP